MLAAWCSPPVQRSEQSQQYVEHSTYVVPRLHGVTYVDSRHTYVRTFYDGSERGSKYFYGIGARIEHAGTCGAYGTDRAKKKLAPEP